MFPEHATTQISINREESLLEEATTLQETLSLIDEALQAPDFHERDRREVERSREFFQRRYDTVIQLAGHSIKAAQIAA